MLKTPWECGNFIQKSPQSALTEALTKALLSA
jgi:hypothetical protein